MTNHLIIVPTSTVEKAAMDAHRMVAQSPASMRAQQENTASSVTSLGAQKPAITLLIARSGILKATRRMALVRHIAMHQVNLVNQEELRNALIIMTVTIVGIMTIVQRRSQLHRPFKVWQICTKKRPSGLKRGKAASRVLIIAGRMKATTLTAQIPNRILGQKATSLLIVSHVLKLHPVLIPTQ